MYHQKNVNYVELLWEDFIYQIDNKAYKKQDKMYYPQFIKVIIHYFFTQDKTLSWRNKIGMPTSKDDYLINTLRFISAREETKIYGAILPESLNSPEMKESKAYKTYIGFASVKRPAKKSTQAPARGVVIRETLEITVSKNKEKVDVARGKGIELLSYVALTEEAYISTKPTPSATIIKPSVTNEGTSVKPGVLDVMEEESSKNNKDESDSEHETDDNESGFESDQEEDDEKIEDDEEKEEEEIVKTSSNNSDDEDETKITDKAEGDEDEEMDYTSSLLYDDVDIRMNELPALVISESSPVISTIIPQSL
ncbi:hypothetical protein Tco_1535780 [Tanacetum coccineum]